MEHVPDYPYPAHMPADSAARVIGTSSRAIYQRTAASIHTVLVVLALYMTNPLLAIRIASAPRLAARKRWQKGSGRENVRDKTAARTHTPTQTTQLINSTHTHGMLWAAPQRGATG